MVGAFVGLATLAMLLQFLTLGARLTHVASRLPVGGAELAGQVSLVPVQVVAVSSAMTLAIVYVVGMRITFRVAGPTWHLEQVLAGVLDGKQIEPGHLRREHHLTELCELVNRPTEQARSAQAESARSLEAAGAEPTHDEVARAA
jgi:hypothetical protein